MGTRDILAIERSRLANIRTFLAYLRTSVMFFATGITMIKLFYSDAVLVSVGFLLTISSFAMIIFGIYIYQTAKKHMEISNFEDKKKVIGQESSQRLVEHLTS